MYYVLDDRGEAVATEMMDWAHWYSHVDQSRLVLARTDIKIRGRVLATVETKLCTHTDSLGEKPWLTLVIGTIEQTRTGTRAEAQAEHRRVVSWLERMYRSQR